MQKFTKELHRYLVESGYHYLLLKDVQPVEGTKSFKHIVQPVKEIPAVAIYAVTSIQDEMILSILNGKSSHIELYLERHRDMM